MPAGRSTGRAPRALGNQVKDEPRFLYYSHPGATGGGRLRCRFTVHGGRPRLFATNAYDGALLRRDVLAFSAKRTKTGRNPAIADRNRP